MTTFNVVQAVQDARLYDGHGGRAREGPAPRGGQQDGRTANIFHSLGSLIFEIFRLVFFFFSARFSFYFLCLSLVFSDL